MSTAQLHLVEENALPSSQPKTKPAVSAKNRAKKLSRESATPKTTVAPRVANKKVEEKKTASKPKKRDALASDIMSAPAISCHQRASLNEAVRLMWENDVGVVVVNDDQGRPVGMLSDRDACMAAYTQGVALFHGSVASAMSKTLVSCTFSSSLAEVRELMADAQLRRIPVVDAEGALVGVIGLADLVREAHAAVPKERKRGSSGPMLNQLMDALLQSTP